jgi:hypothetical protein
LYSIDTLQNFVFNRIQRSKEQERAETSRMLEQLQEDLRKAELLGVDISQMREQLQEHKRKGADRRAYVLMAEHLSRLTRDFEQRQVARPVTDLGRTFPAMGGGRE